MPPHCDTLDGPVVNAARLALEKENVHLILPWAHKKAEREIKKSFRDTVSVRKAGKKVAKLADLWFYETVVRLHREGEGAPYTGLKPKGLDWGPVVPKADRAVEIGDATEVIQFLQKAIEEEVQKRFNLVKSLKSYKENDVKAARAYVQAMLGFVLYSHYVFSFIKSDEVHHEEAEGRQHH